MASRPDGNLEPRTSRLWLVGVAAGVILMAVGSYVLISARNAARPRLLFDQADLVWPSDPVRALVLLDESIKVAGGQFAEAQLLKCRVLVKRGQIAGAAAEFSAIVDWPDDQRSQWISRLKDLVDTEYEAVEEKLALEHCEKFSQLVPESPVPWLISASILHMNSESLRALDAYRKAFACELPPKERLRISYQIVTLTLNAGDLPGARQQLGQLLKLEQSLRSSDKELVSEADEQAFQVLQASLLYREQSIPESLLALNKLLVKWPDSLGGRLLRGDIYLEQGRFEEAAEDLKHAVELNPFETRGHYKLGQAYLGLKRGEKARECLNRSHELTLLQVKIRQLQEEYFNDPTNAEVAKQLAELNTQRGSKGLADYWTRAASRAARRP